MQPTQSVAGPVEGITIIGVGYVGLVTGTCLAEAGNTVKCVDINAARIEGLRQGVLPIYEPGLADLVSRNYGAGRLDFTTDLRAALAQTSVVIIAVGTPQDAQTGEADLTALWAVARDIRRLATEPKLVVVKSTVPVGTNRRLATILNDGNSIQHRTASNPEFLKEGHAIEDFMKPNRVVVGVRDPESEAVLRTLHAPFLRSDRPFLAMSPESAEMTKYAANCMLATKITFINEMANLCEAVGADINQVRRGIGHDERIGFQFLYPGAGYGGSCFPKDVRAVMHMAESVATPSLLLPAVDLANDRQKERLFHKITQLFGANLSHRCFAVWGLAFKPETDDIREAPSLVLVRSLLAAGAEVRVYDPEAIENARTHLGDSVTYCSDTYAAVQGCDALAVVTEWKEFHAADLPRVARALKTPVIVDGRNLYDPDLLENLGFTYLSIGRRDVLGGSPGHVRRAA